MKIIQINKGDMFGQSIVISDLGGKKVISKNGNISTKRYIECKCKCGNIFISLLSDLKSGNTKGCGCTRGFQNKIHGLTHSKIYNSWMLLKQRCNNMKKEYYHRYGGRGITYDKKWETFEGFYEDMGDTYKQGLTIDRIDVNGNYCKENCRWATMKEQQNNKSNNRLYKGKPISYWIKELGLSENVYSRLSRGWTEEEALYGKKY